MQQTLLTIKGLRISGPLILNAYRAMNLFIECNARTAVVGIEIENLGLTLLLLDLLYRPYATNPAIEVLRISGPLVLILSMAMDLFMECNARTTVVGVVREN